MEFRDRIILDANDLVFLQDYLFELLDLVAQALNHGSMFNCRLIFASRMRTRPTAIEQIGKLVMIRQDLANAVEVAG